MNWKENICQSTDVSQLLDIAHNHPYLLFRELAQSRLTELTVQNGKEDSSDQLEVETILSQSEPYKMILACPKHVISGFIKPSLIKDFVNFKMILKYLQEEEPLVVLNTLALSIIEGIKQNSFEDTLADFEIVSNKDPLGDLSIKPVVDHTYFKQEIQKILTPKTKQVKTPPPELDWTNVEQNIDRVEKFIQQDRRHAIHCEGKIKNGIIWAQPAKEYQEQHGWKVEYIYTWGAFPEKAAIEELTTLWQQVPLTYRKQLKDWIDTYKPKAEVFLETEQYNSKYINGDLNLILDYFEYQRYAIEENCKSKTDFKFLTKEKVVENIIAPSKSFINNNPNPAAKNFLSKVEEIVTHQSNFRTNFTPITSWDIKRQDGVQLLFEITKQQEKQEAWRKITDNTCMQQKRLVVEIYDSWAQHLINNGICLEKIEDDIKFSYTPYIIQSSDFSQTVHNISFDPKQIDFIVEETLNKQLETKRFSQEDIVLLDLKARRGPGFRKLVAISECNGERYPLIDANSKLFVTGETTYENARGEYSIRPQEELAEYLNKLPELEEVLSKTDKLSSFRNEVKHHQQIFLSAAQTINGYLKVKDVINSGKTFNIQLEEEQINMFSLQDIFENFLKRKIISWLRIDLYPDFTIPLTMEYVKYTCEEVKHTKQQAPVSERGTCVLYASSIEQGLNYLKQQHIIEQTVPHIPKHKTQNLQIIGEEQIISENNQTVLLPENYHIFHAITGNPEIEIMERIIHHKGLLSIKDRRNLGLLGKSLSPLGDIASGLDHGVATNINDYPVYSSNIIFILEPNLLMRKHVWFADKDYGGGVNRLQFYNQYAQQLGMKNYRTIPNYEARSKHLHTITNIPDNTNELYVAGGISLHSIKYVLVKTDIQKEWEDNILIQSQNLPAFFYQSPQELKDFLWTIL